MVDGHLKVFKCRVGEYVDCIDQVELGETADLTKDELVELEPRHDGGPLGVSLSKAAIAARQEQNFAEVDELLGQKLVKVVRQRTEEQCCDLGTNLCFTSLGKGNQSAVSFKGRNLVDIGANNAIKDLHKVTRALAGEDTDQIDCLVGVNAESIRMHGVLKASQEGLWDLTIVIHGDVGSGDKDEVLDMHLSEGILVEPLLDLVEVFVHEDGQVDREVVQ